MTRRDRLPVETRLSDLGGAGPQEEDFLVEEAIWDRVKVATDREDPTESEGGVVPEKRRRRVTGEWKRRKRGKGFANGGPRKGVAYEVERVRVVTPECEEARRAYPLAAVCVRFRQTRASLRWTLWKSDLPYLVVLGGPGGKSIYVPRSTLEALVARKIRRVGNWPTTSRSKEAPV